MNQSSSDNTSDLRMTSSISRYQLPSPISGLYCKYQGAETYSQKYGLALLLVEGIFRFLTYVNVSNVIAVQSAP